MQPLTEKFRPRRLADIVGQSEAIEVLSRFVARPCSQAFLLIGATGTGKSSCAWALATELGCDMDPRNYFSGGLSQIAAGKQTADDVREQAEKMSYIPWSGSGWRCLIVNEADQCSKQTQTIWLDVLESLPPRNVVVFSTNETDGLDRRFQDRCIVLRFDAGREVKHHAAANSLIERIWTAERPGEAVPTIRDLDIQINHKEISYRGVVQAVARRLLDPAPFIPPAPEPAPAALFVSQVIRPAVASRPAPKPMSKPYVMMTGEERRAADAHILNR